MSLVPPPASFDGPFPEFFERYVEPNLPSPERVAAFDALLSRYLSQEDPLYVVRYVNGLVRGTISRSDTGARMLPTDNAPVWWLHAFLHSGRPLPPTGDVDSFFANIPCHFFTVAKYETLNQAGYHAAHILGAKNWDTGWKKWTRTELSRRMLLNIHPCNMFLVAKEGWRTNGDRPEIISWIRARYARRYSGAMAAYLSAVAPNVRQSSDVTVTPAPRYRYDQSGRNGDNGPRPERPLSSPPRTGRISQRGIENQLAFDLAPAARPSEIAQGARREVSGVVIWRHRVGLGHSYIYITPGGRYLVPHDDVVAWVGSHKKALGSESWLGSTACYAWSRNLIPDDMLAFLKNYPSV